MINTPIPTIDVDLKDTATIINLYRATLESQGRCPKIIAVDAARLYEIHKVTCMIESRVAIEKAMKNARQN